MHSPLFRGIFRLIFREVVQPPVPVRKGYIYGKTCRVQCSESKDREEDFGPHGCNQDWIFGLELSGPLMYRRV